jgi:hypothetical protein
MTQRNIEMREPVTLNHGFENHKQPSVPLVVVNK